MVRNIRGGLLWGILLTALIGIPMGVTHFDRLFSAPPSLEPVFLQFEWSHVFSWDMLVVVLTFLFVDLFDTVGTVIAVSLKADMVDKDGRIENVGRMLMADAVATTAGACLGTIMYVLMKTGTGMKGIRQISPTVWVLFVIFVLRYVQKSM